MSWPDVPLADFADIERTGVKPEDIVSGTEYLGLEHIESGGEIIGRETVENGDLASTKFSFTADHVLYGKLRPYLAKIALPDFSGVCSTDIVPIRPGPELDRRYLAYFLRQPTMVDFANSRSTGANLPRLSPKSLAEFPIPLPPLEEQKRIAAILDQADALRRLRARALDKLYTLGQAIFHEMFGDELRSENRIKLGDLIEVRSSLDDPKLPKNASLPHVGPEHIISGSGVINWTTVRTCGEDGVRSGKYIFQAGDVLYSKIRPYLNKVAMADRKGMCSADMYALHAPNGSISNRFLHFVLFSRDFLSYADTVSSRANIPKINRKQLLDYATAIPLRVAQEEFGEKLKGMDAQADHIIRAQNSSANLFGSLQAQVFSGGLEGAR